MNWLSLFAVKVVFNRPQKQELKWKNGSFDYGSRIYDVFKLEQSLARWVVTDFVLSKSSSHLLIRKFSKSWTAVFPHLHRYTFPTIGTGTHFLSLGTGYSFLTLGSRACHRLHISCAWHRYPFPALAPIHIYRSWHRLLISFPWQPHLPPVTHFPRLHRYTFPALGTSYSFLTLGSRTWHQLHISSISTVFLMTILYFAPAKYFQFQFWLGVPSCGTISKQSLDRIHVILGHLLVSE